MPIPFTRAQAVQNAAFLRFLFETGNVRLSAREAGVKYGTIQHRRSVHAGFAQDWDAAIAAAHARFHLGGGKRGPEAVVVMEDPSSRAGSGREGKRTGRKMDSGLRRNDGRGEGLRTKGGEPMVVRTKSGKLQLRAAHPDKLTKAAEQAFLAALSATANIRLSAAAAGASAAAFYRRRQKDPAFAREFRLALEMGYSRLEAAALMAALPQSHEDDQWRHNSPPPIPPMSPDQALQLLFLHEKSVRQGWEKPHRRRRRGESDAVYTKRLGAMWGAEKAREAEDAALRRAAQYEETGDWRFEAEAPPLPLPPLHLVTGWSRADPEKKPHDPDVALFGGWRIADMRRKAAEG